MISVSLLRSNECASASFTQPGSNRGQFRETIRRLMCRPANSTQDQQPIERVVESPGEVAGDADKDATFGLFPDPNLRLRLAVFDGSSEHSYAGEISREFPIAFVHKLGGIESGGEFVRAEPKFFRSVSEARTRSPGAPKSRSQRFDVPICVHGPM